LLATHFAAKYARPGTPIKQFSPQAMEVLLDYRWQGNIRELENLVERVCVTSQDQTIQRENLPQELLSRPSHQRSFHVSLDRPLRNVLEEAIDAIERQYLRKALKKTRGNVGRCARLCGLSRRSITLKIAKYQLNKSEFKEA
jgi:DNA-binding NtrC family response regulator